MDIIDRVVAERDPIRRLALLGCHCAYQHTGIEKFPSKPFNPLLGETWEYVVPGKFKFFAEQVSHHPPITAYIVQGDSGYLKYTSNKVKSKFTGTSLSFSNVYKEYIEILPFGEKYHLKPPVVGVHNLIIGSPYLDPQGKGYVRNLACPNEQYVELDFPKRGWSEDTYFRVSGSVYSSPGVVAYKIDGKWNKSIYLTDVRTGTKELVWTKEPYPEFWEYQYGMTYTNLQHNYLPNTLRPWLPPTDTRFRPDQRALENGDFKLAAVEKNRLEEKQRAIRRYNEKNGI